jgi:hypothetical protein
MLSRSERGIGRRPENFIALCKALVGGKREPSLERRAAIVVLRDLPGDLCSRIGSGCQVTLDFLGIIGLKHFDPFAFQIHKVDMELDDTFIRACMDAVMAVHDRSGHTLQLRAAKPSDAFWSCH